MKLYMFWAVPLPIIRSSFTVHSALVYVIQVWRHIPVPSVQWINSWWWAEELPKTCRVSCRSKFGKLVHLVGFIIKKFVTMHSHMNIKFIYAVYLQFVEHVVYLCDRNKREWAQFFNILRCTKWRNDSWNLNFKTKAVILSVWGAAMW
jgi:hypothetical protein